MILTKLCYRYNQLRQEGMKYYNTLEQLASEYSYSTRHMKVIVQKAFKSTGIEMWRSKGRYRVA
jgi:MarR-like DNA-binding transcriptional regulator SgrR of sgrS sRNA